MPTPPLHPAARANRVVEADGAPIQTHTRAQKRFARGSRDGPRIGPLWVKGGAGAISLWSQRRGPAWQLPRAEPPVPPNGDILRALEAIADLVGPEALQPHKGLVQALEILKRDLANAL